MEIVKGKKEKIITDKFEKINRSMQWEGGEVIMKGAVRAFARTKEGVQQFFAMGGFSDWRPLDIPDTAEYVAVIKIKIMDDRGRQHEYLPGDIVTLNREIAISLMCNMGRVRPKDPAIPDISVFFAHAI